MKQNKSKNLLIIIGALAYVVYFGIIKGLELQLPMYIKVLFWGLMLAHCFFQFQELIKQRKEEKLKWANATEVEKVEQRKNQKFAWLMLGAFIFLGAFLIGITALVG